MALRLVAALVASLIAASSAWAQAWPTRPVRIICAWPAGGPADVISRVLAAGLQETLGQNVIVENRGGAGGVIGSDAVAKAAPDGHTLLVTIDPPLTISRHLVARMPYDSLTDFTPITLLGASAGQVLVVHPSFPARSFQEFMDHLRASPGRYGYASGGVGSPGHIVGAAFAMRTGLDLVHVPYRGNAPAVTDVLAGHVPIMFGAQAGFVEAIRAGQIRALAVTAATRSPIWPDLPTLMELGVDGFDLGYWWIGLLGPARMPQAVVERLHRETLRIMATERMRAQMALNVLEPLGLPGEAFRARMARESDSWGAIVRALDIRAAQ